MATWSTWVRISNEARERLTARARLEGTSATALLERLITEGIAVLDHPGIVFRGPPHDRRAGLAAGPDVWEIIARLQELAGSQEERIALLAEETDLHPRQIRLAVDYASEHPEDVRARIARRESAADASRRGNMLP